MDHEQRAASELNAHLRRLTIWSGPGFVLGLAGYLLMAAEPLRSALGMHAGWCLVNLAIALPGLIRPKPVDSAKKLREFLIFNLGLNFGYIGVGVALAALGTSLVVGAGWAVALNGLALLVLDGILLKRLPAD